MWKGSQKHQAAIQRLRLLIKLGSICKKWQKQMRNSKQRYKILEYWSQTQTSYIKDLKIIENDIQRPLKQAKLITDEEDRLLFPNIKAMIDLSNNMNACIDETIRTWNPKETMIGDKLMKFCKFFKIYREYCNNFMKAQQIVKNLKNIPEAVKIEEKLSLDFASYTIKPVQRPPKYQLLLREYQKALPKSHNDHQTIQSAIKGYQEVNEQNDQSMDRQIRAEIMIKLEKKYGNVISSRSGRQYLKEFTCQSVNFKCIVYAFNDMLLLIQKRSDGYEQIYKRLYLDGASYLDYKRHFKYFDNIVFVSGANKSAHLEFDTIADAEHFFEVVQNIIDNLHKRENERRIRFKENQVRRKNLEKFRVSKWHDDVESKIIYKPKLEIKVQSTMKSRSYALYAVRFKVIYPYNISQTVLITFDKVASVRQFMRGKFKNFEYTKLSYIPQHIGIIQAAKNRAKIMQYHSFIIQEFLNLVFHNQQFYNIWRSIAEQIGLNLDLFQFVTSEDFSCNCNLCIEMNDKHSVSYYRILLKNPKEQTNRLRVKSTVGPQDTVVFNDKSELYHGSIAKMVVKSCPFYIFNVIHNIRKADKGSVTNFPEKMLALEAQMGQINYTLLAQDSIPLRSSVTLRIYLLSIEQEYIEITLKEDKCVRQILEEIATLNSLETIFDWSLYIYEEGQYTRINNQEKLLDFVSKWGADIERFEEESNNHSFFRSKIDGLMKWGEQFWGSKKAKVFMKKSLHFEQELQIQACKANKERYHFLINEVFGRIKFQNMSVTYQQITVMSAFYLLKNQFKKVKDWNEDNIDLTSLKELLPAVYFAYLKSDKFKKDLIIHLKKYYAELENFQNSRNAIELIYLKILNFLRNNQEWITLNFVLSTYKGAFSRDIILGINYKCLTVSKLVDKKPITTIKLQNLKYKTSTTSIFIYEGQKVHRYDGEETNTIRQLIQTYLCYARIFNPKV